MKFWILFTQINHKYLIFKLEHLQVINEVLEYCGFSERVRVPEECTPSMFICVFESLFKAKLGDIKRYIKKIGEKKVKREE